mgnify:CR=1 FL=1
MTLFWLAIEELDMTDDSNFFPGCFHTDIVGVSSKKEGYYPNKSKKLHRLMVGTPCAVAYAHFHIKLIQGRKTPPAGNETCTCLNCGTTYTGNYCNRCGQSRNTPTLSVEQRA